MSLGIFVEVKINAATDIRLNLVREIGHHRPLSGRIRLAADVLQSFEENSNY